MRLGTLRRSFLLAATTLAMLLQACGGGGGATLPVPAITDINGAATASGNAGSAFIVDGTGFGALSGPGTTSGYTVDFRDATSNSVVATAGYAGSGWTNTFIKADVPNSGLTAGTTYKVTVTTLGGTSNSVSFTLVASVAFSPSTIAWGSTSALPQAIQGFPTVVAPVSVTSGSTTTTTNHIYTFGGNTGSSGLIGASSANVTAVYSNTVNDGTNGTTAGTLAATSWKTEANALPAARGFAGGALANGFNSQVSGSGTVYVLGGLDASGTATSTVYYASLGSDGSVGMWGTTTALPQARYAFGAVIFHGRLYVAGGNDGTTMPTATVYSAQINSNGTLGAWSTLPSLAAPVAYHQLVTTGGVLYVLGGTSTAAVDPTSTAQSAGSVPDVYYNSVNPDGTLSGTGWTSNPNKLRKAVEKYTVVAIGANVLASGGLYSGSPGSTEEQYATQSTTDASLGAFNGATGSNTISGTTGGYNFFNQSAALYVDPVGSPHVMILGGQTVGTIPTMVQTGVWYMR